MPIVSQGEKYQPNTVAEWSHTLHKYGFERAAAVNVKRVTGRIAPRAVADLPLVLVPNGEYYGLIDIGTPAQTLKVKIDTGSARLIISSKECPGCTGETHFDRSASSTYQPLDEPWSVKFNAAASASGATGHDVVKVADLKIKDQPVHLAEQMSLNFDGVVDGILGLSFGVLSDTTTVLEKMMEGKLVDNGVVSFALGKTGGEALFGGIDMSKVEDSHEIAYTDVVNDRYWVVKTTDTLVDGQSVFVEGSNKELMAVIDTGTTLLVMPLAVPSAIHKMIPKAIQSQDRWYVPCTGTQKLEFQIGGVKFGVPYSDIAREKSELQQGMCHSSVQTNPGSFAIIGDVFIKNHYVVFDEENRRIGFALLKQQ